MKKITSGETIKYSYGDLSRGGKAPTGYINYFPYISVESVQQSPRTFRKSSSGEWSYKVVKEGEQGDQVVKTKIPLTCDNLLQPEEIPFLIAKPRYSYTVRFQVVGNKVRALLLAPAEDLPSQSLVYSYKIAAREGREIYAMPIGGYHVLPGYIEQQENTDWEATNVLGFKKVPIRKRGKYKTESIAGIPSSWPTYQDGKNNSQPVREVQFASEFTAFKSLAEQGGKRDVYPKSFFSGDWYYASTVIANSVSSDPKIFPGFNFSNDSQLWVSNKIRLDFRNKHLVAYTLNKETEPDKEPRSISAEREVFRIPIIHLDHRTSSPLGNLNAGLEEIPDGTKRKKEMNYFQAQFDQIELSRIGRLPEFQLNEITVSEDYFSFVLRSEEDESQLRFSFLKPVPEEDRGYKPLIFDRTFENFPVFFQRKRVNLKNKFTYSEEFQSSMTVQRFDPEKPIVYRFSTLTPNNPLIRNIGREIIAIWAQIFEQAGVSCVGGPCIKLLPEAKDDAELGDIRYNILNLISPEDFLRFGAYGGWGPSIADFETGEVISATANLYLDDMYAQLVRTIYLYIQSRSGLILPWAERQKFTQKDPSDSSLTKKISFPVAGWKIYIPRLLLSWNPISWRYELDPDDRQLMNPVPLFGLDWKMVEDNEGVYKTVDFLSAKDSHFSSENGEHSLPFQIHQTSFPGTGDDFHCGLQSEGFLPTRFRYHLIDTLCGEHFTLLKEASVAGIINESPHERRNWLRGKSKDHTEEIYRCADKLLKFAGLGIGLHEVGHNMSMPHNFSASADKNNFLSINRFHYDYTFESDEQKEQVRSLFPSEGVTASIMDYLPSGEMQIAPGKYDTDFIRFLYKGEMETENGELVTAQVSDWGELQYINSGGEVVPQRELRQYKVCDDISHLSSKDIYCNMWDRGTTPSEIVGYHRDYLVDNLSLYGNSISPFVHVVEESVKNFFEGTRKIYHKWRIELSKKLDIADPLYLKGISAEEYKERIFKILCGGDIVVTEEETDKINAICETEEIVRDEELAELYRARTIIYRTFRDLLFSTKDHYCIFKNRYKDDLEEWVPFSEIHRHLMETSREDLRRNYSELSSCDDIKDLIDRTGKRYIGETGVSLYSGVFSISQNREYNFHRILTNSQMDYSGSIEGRAISGLALFGENRSSILGPLRQALSLMNEPDIREEVLQSLKDRIFKGIRINVNNDEEESVFYPVFSNEELLWRLLALPLFTSFRHLTHSEDKNESILESSAVLRSVGFVNRKLLGISRDFVQIRRVIKYERILRLGGYIIRESKELYPQSKKEATALFTKKIDTPYLNQLIQSLRAIDLRKSFMNFTWKIHEEIHKDDPKASFQDKKEKANSYMEDLKTAVKELYSDPSLFVNMLTFSLLYDYLEVGEPSDFSFSEPNYGMITNLLVQQLQIVRILEFKTEGIFKQVFNQDFKQKCTEGSDNCFIYNLIPKSDQEREVFFKLIDKEQDLKDDIFNEMLDLAMFQDRKVETVNIARPSIMMDVIGFHKHCLQPEGSTCDFEIIIESLERNCKQQGTCKAMSDLLHDLYLMELFKSDHHENSIMRKFLEKSMITLQGLIPEEKNEIDTQRRRRILDHIALLRTLKNHANSKLFQEIFIRNMLFYSWIPRKGEYVSAVHELIVILDLVSPFYVREFFDTEELEQATHLQQDKIYLDTRERQLRAEELYSALFLTDRKLLGNLQYFQRNAPDILEQSFEEVMNTVRIAPPLPDNPDNGLEYFYRVFSLNESAPLYEIFNGRMGRELEAQRNIIIEAIFPRLTFGDEDDIILGD